MGEAREEMRFEGGVRLGNDTYLDGSTSDDDFIWCIASWLFERGLKRA